MKLSQGILVLLGVALSSNLVTPANALESNPEESPQLLNSFTDVCSSAQGRSSACEVELDVPASCITTTTAAGSVSSSDCPIVFFFHGAGGTNDWFARTTGVHDEGVIGVYPQGENGWNTGPKETNVCAWDDYDCTEDPDEGAFIASIINELRNVGANGNVYLIGNSNGAALAMRLASNAGDDLPIKGIVTKVTQLLALPSRNGPGVLNYNQPGSGGPKVSVLNLMGKDDLLIPYEGGSSSVFGTGGDESFQLMSALESMMTWAAHNGCSSRSPVITGGINFSNNADPNGEATFYEYGGCPEGIILEHYALHGAGHTFGQNSALDGVSIDYDLAYDFISRVEAGILGGGGGGAGAGPVTSSTHASSPVQSVACGDDPDWHAEFNVDRNCRHVGLNPEIRCNWGSTDGSKALDACKETCGGCTGSSSLIVSPVSSSPTGTPVTSNPTAAPTSRPTKNTITASPISSMPTSSPVQGVAPCEDDPSWHGKFSVANTCDYIGERPTRRCNFESMDGTKALLACKKSCDQCYSTTSRLLHLA